MEQNPNTRIPESFGRFSSFSDRENQEWDERLARVREYTEVMISSPVEAFELFKDVMVEVNQLTKGVAKMGFEKGKVKISDMDAMFFTIAMEKVIDDRKLT